MHPPAPFFVADAETQMISDNAPATPGFFITGVRVEGPSLKTLLPRSELNDEIINAYFRLLNQYPYKHANFWCTNSFFFKHVSADDQAKARRYLLPKNMGDRQVGQLFVPLHLHQPKHWVLAVIDLDWKVISIYDSCFVPDGRIEFRTLFEWFQVEFPGIWTMELKKNAPQQDNAYDCGVFCVFVAACILRGEPLTFQQSDLDRNLARIQLCIQLRPAPLSGQDGVSDNEL